MPDLLLELRSEEIPARMQRKAAGDLRKLVTDALVDAGLTYEGAREYWTPRRLTLDLRGLTARSADIREERKGPRTDAPQKALEGFVRGAGLESIDQAEVRSDSKKGDFYVAVIEKPGRAAEEVIAEVMPKIIGNFPWPKSMRWGAKSADAGSLRWVRPLQSILCTFGPETEEPQVIAFEAGGVTSGNITFGHRFHAPDTDGNGAIIVRRFEDYVAALEKAKVVLDAERRKDMIRADAQNLAFAKGLELVEDEALLEEVANLVEWPVPLMSSFEADYLNIPDEVIRLTIKENQKCFVLRKSQGGAGEQGQGGADEHESALTNDFILVANVEASDGGVEIARGNAKVVNARLADAKFFWETDLQQIKSGGFDPWLKKLDDVTFHAKLGSQGERVKRIMALAEELAPVIAESFNARVQGAEKAPGADAPPPRSGGKAAHVSAKDLARMARRAAELAKADLNSQMVNEFPELQGFMGRQYALATGEDESVARAVEEHWSPQGPSDDVPTDPVSIAVALADKLDTLVGFWAVDEKPTGSKDPYALRRAALGVIRLVLENELDTNLLFLFDAALEQFATTEIHLIHEIYEFEGTPSEQREFLEFNNVPMMRAFSGSTGVTSSVSGHPSFFKFVWFSPKLFLKVSKLFPIWQNEYVPDDGPGSLLAFFHDRQKVYLRDSGARHDLIDAVLSDGASNSPLSTTQAKPDTGSAGEMLPKATEGGQGLSSSLDAAEDDADSASPPLSAAQTSPPQGERGASVAANDDLLAIHRRVEALGTFLETDDGKNLLAGTKRAANILAAEEKKKTSIADTVDPALFETDEERALFDSLEKAEGFARQAIGAEDYAKAMSFLSQLRAPVDAFFNNVMVNADDDNVRANRLALMRRIRDATGAVADFSKIAG